MPSVLVAFIVTLITGTPGLIFPTLPILTLGWGILMCPLSIGMMFFYLDLVRTKTTPSTSEILAPYNEFLRYLGACVLVLVYTYLWMLLLIVPGIIKSISYSMTFFIMKDDPQIGVSEAITKSQRMMDGHKMELFLLQLSFIGWLLLGIITVIGLFWVIPYMYTAMATFYVRLKESGCTEGENCTCARANAE